VENRTGATIEEINALPTEVCRALAWTRGPVILFSGWDAARCGVPPALVSLHPAVYNQGLVKALDHAWHTLGPAQPAWSGLCALKRCCLVLSGCSCMRCELQPHGDPVCRFCAEGACTSAPKAASAWVLPEPARACLSVWALSHLRSSRCLRGPGNMADLGGHG